MPYSAFKSIGEAEIEGRDFYMKTLTLRIDDSIVEKFLWLLEQFKSQIKILDQSDYVSDDEYLRSIDGMVQSIKEAREEPENKGVTLNKLDW